MISITLSGVELWIADMYAEWDMAEAAETGQDESHGQDDEPLPIRIQGQRGEIAFKKAAGLELTHHTLYAPDTPIAEVRTVPDGWRGLIYRKDDIRKGPETRFVSVSTEKFPEIQIRGWMTGRELNTPRCWENGEKIHNKRPRASLGDPTQFHPLTEVILQTWMLEYFRTIDARNQYGIIKG